MEDEQIIQGGLYHHCKSPENLYRILGTAFDLETKEEMVICRQMYDSLEFKKRTRLVIPKKSFLEYATFEDNVKIPLFKFIGTVMPENINREKRRGKSRKNLNILK